MTEEQQERLAEYNARIEQIMNVYNKYPMASVSDSLTRIYEEMDEDELLQGLEL